MDWDDARHFLAIAREGQMLGAAKRMGVSQARLSRRLAALEEGLGARLFDRSTRGCELTDDGRVLMAAAERMEAEMLGAMAALGRGAEVSGIVRIGAPDGFGVAFLAPRLGALRAAHPALVVQLAPLPRSFSLSQREADLAVMVGRPEKGRLRARLLTDYSLSLYAARSYLDRAGAPGSAEDLRGHDLVGHVEDLVHTPELRYAEEFLKGWPAAIQVSTAAGQLAAVTAGAGIGVLHDFMAAPLTEARGGPLVPLLPDMRALRSYWIAWHENLRGSARVAAAAEALDRMVRAEAAIFVREG